MSEEKNDFFYFAEQTSPNPEDVKSIDYKKHTEGDIWWLSFPAVIMEFEKIGRNDRQYLGDNIMENVFSERNKSYMAHEGWFGEGDHPWVHKEGEQLTRKRIASIYLPNRSHKITKPERRGHELHSIIETCPATEVGRGLAIDMLTGYIPCFSCRCTGLMKLIGGRPTVITNFISTFDWVLYPGFDGAGQKGAATAKSASIPFAESVDDTTMGAIPLNEIYNDLAETDPSLNAYMESYNLDLQNIVGISGDKKDVIVQPEPGLYIFTGMSKKSIDMVNDFYRSNF